MNVLSLCDGMSCGQIALELAGIKVDQYFASEIKKHAIRVTKTNFPNTIQLGDVRKISYRNGILHSEKGYFKVNFDLVCFGSPCQSFSRAMNKDMRIGLEDDVRSGLFYECKRILDEVNPKYFLLENVIMKDSDEAVLTESMGVEPIRINSEVVTGQMRDRLYWTNIPFNGIRERRVSPEDILDEELGGYFSSFPTRSLIATDSHGFFNGSNMKKYTAIHRQATTGFINYVVSSKSEFLEYQSKSKAGITKDNEYPNFRFLTKYERARLQGCPEKYADCMSEKEAADLFGDGWTCSVIAQIFEGMKTGETQVIHQQTLFDYLGGTNEND